MEKITELKGYRNNDYTDEFKNSMKGIDSDGISFARNHGIRVFKEFLESKGFHILGNGAFGLVFTHPNLDYCIKVFKCDPAYLAFVKAVLENPNPHFPRFRGKFMRVEQDYYAVRMEKLTVGSGLLFYNTVNLVEMCWDDPKFLNRFPTSEWTSDEEKQTFKTINETQPLLWNAVTYLAEKLKNFQNDIHSGNLMMRGSTIVITDPVYTSG